MDNDDMKLSRMLKEHDEPYIDDAGFTPRVMEALPPARRHPAWLNRRTVLLGATALLSCLLATYLAGPRLGSDISGLVQTLVETPVLNTQGLSLGIIPLLCLAGGLIVGCLLAFRVLRNSRN